MGRIFATMTPVCRNTAGPKAAANIVPNPRFKEASRVMRLIHLAVASILLFLAPLQAADSKAELASMESSLAPKDTPPPKPSKKAGFLATYAEYSKWQYGSTLLGFLARNNIPESTYYNLAPEDKELVADVKTDSDIFIVREANGALLQAFLPLNAETQARVFFDYKQNAYKIEIIPIISLHIKQKVVARIQDGGGPSKALYNATKDSKLNQEFLAAYKLRRTVQKGDRVAVLYHRKYRLGKPIGSPEVQVVAVESNKKFHYFFGFQNRYYNEEGKEMASFFLSTPVKYRRISSRFSSGRVHPILGYTRPHYGVDFSAATGTPVYAAGEGKIVFAGTKGGYGKVVEIQHVGGLRTLYAHLSKISKNSRVGASIRQGTQIGAVGSTGLSTGPHLHFGVYKNNKPINPLGQIRTARSELSGKSKQAFLGLSSASKKELDHFVASIKLDEGLDSATIRVLMDSGGAPDLDNEEGLYDTPAQPENS